MPNQLSNAEGAARISGRWLDPDLLEGSLSEQATIPHTVERHPSSKAQGIGPGLSANRAGHAQHDFLTHHLDRPSQVHLFLSQLALGLAGWSAEQLVKLAVRHGEAGQIIEVALIEREGPILLQVDQLPVDQIHVFRIAVWRQAHDLVLA
jgi:hypothetical protein